MVAFPVGARAAETQHPLVKSLLRLVSTAYSLNIRRMLNGETRFLLVQTSDIALAVSLKGATKQMPLTASVQKLRRRFERH